MRKLIALALAGAFVGAVAVSSTAPSAFAAEQKAKASTCDKIKDEKKNAACQKKEAAAAAKKMKKESAKKTN